MATCATPKMTFALFCATKVDVRNLDLSFEETSMLIGMTKNGKTQEAIEYLKKKGGVPKGEVKDKVDWQELYNKAHAAGLEAVSKLQVTPMVVTGHANPLDDSSPVTEAYYVADGVCGFGWVNVKPGNSAFAKWLVKNDYASKSYEGGVTIWVSYFNQSLQKKEAYAYAFAKVLSDNGIRAYAGSRMD